jgi:hypothetical protein
MPVYYVQFLCQWKPARLRNFSAPGTQPLFKTQPHFFSVSSPLLVRNCRCLQLLYLYTDKVLFQHRSYFGLFICETRPDMLARPSQSCKYQTAIALLPGKYVGVALFQ